MQQTSALEKYLKKKIPFLAKKYKVTPTDLDQIEKDSEAALEILEDPKFQFFRDYLEMVQKSITELFIQNRLKPTKEYFFNKDKVTEHTITRKESEFEASGQYKLVDKIITDLKTTAELHQKYKEEIDKGRVIIDNGEEE